MCTHISNSSTTTPANPDPFSRSISHPSLLSSHYPYIPPPLTPPPLIPPPLTPPPGQKERDTAQAKRNAKKSRNRDPENRDRSLLREIGDTYRGPNTYFDTPTNTSFNTPTNNTLLQTSSNNPFNPSFNTSSPPLLVPLSRDRSGGIQRQRTDGQ